MKIEVDLQDYLNLLVKLSDLDKEVANVTANNINSQPICKTDEFGARRWYLNGQLHREDGPAVELPNGDKSWYFNDQLHREDGPAQAWSDGAKYWWYHGKYINSSSQKEFERLIKKNSSSKIENNQSICQTDEYGNKRWFLNNQLHREDGPAIDHIDGYKAWYINDQRHRIDGPAVEGAYVQKYWWYHGKYINCDSQEKFERLISKKK